MLPGPLKNAWSRLFGFGHLAPEEIEYRALALTIIALIALLDFVYNLSYFLFGFPFIWWTSVLYLCAALLNLYRLKHGGSFRVFRNLQIFMTIALPCLAQITHGGFTGSSGVVLAGFLAPTGAMMFGGVRTARISFYGFVLALLAAGLWEYYAHPDTTLVPPGVQLLFFLFNFSFTASVVYFLMEGFLRNKTMLIQLLREEYQKSDRLLLDIFPAETAKELKENGSVKAKSYEQATVLFTDFIHFSEFARVLSAEAVVEQVDFYFSAFDEIIRRHGVEKIKTIGDAYMCVGGLPVPQTDHAERVLRAALEIRDFVLRQREQKLEQFGYPFNIRIGVHTGPVVAGVVGSSKMAYDIWGETVNIAARMEESCEPNKINISQATYNLTRETFDMHYRGHFPVKHMGTVAMYFAEGVREG